MTQFRQERDQPALGKAVLVGVTSLLIFGLGMWFAGRIQRGAEARLEATAGEPPHVPDTELGEVGMVNQPMFEVDRRTPLRLMHAEERLATYGWVDQKAGTVHIPIERAMDLLVREASEAARGRRAP